MKATKRLSLADFKVTKMESQNEIDKLIGGAAADCHTYNGEPTKNVKVGDFTVSADKDYGTMK